LEESRRQLPDIEKLKKEAEKWKDLAEKYKIESERWHRMYVQLTDETRISSKTAEIFQSPNRADKPGNSFSSWINSSPLSYILNTRTGRLVKNSSEYKFIERRGSNFNSNVWKAVFKSSNSEKIVAIKKITTSSSLDTWREAMLLDKLDHKNIIKLEGLLRGAVMPGVASPSDFLILQFMPYDLEFVLADQIAFKNNSKYIKFILYQILSAIYYLHSADVCHGDIKPTSVLLDESFNVKLGSFVFAKSLYTKQYQPFPFSRYCAPENVYNHEMKPSEMKASDIWSLGVLFAEMLKGIALFDVRDKNAFLYQVFSITETRPNSSFIMRNPSLNSVPSVKHLPLSDKFKGYDISVEAFDLLKEMMF